jgi:hypothetical protein
MNISDSMIGHIFNTTKKDEVLNNSNVYTELCKSSTGYYLPGCSPEHPKYIVIVS